VGFGVEKFGRRCFLTRRRSVFAAAPNSGISRPAGLIDRARQRDRSEQLERGGSFHWLTIAFHFSFCKIKTVASHGKSGKRRWFDFGPHHKMWV
jgi:hypothetical protein